MGETFQKIRNNILYGKDEPDPPQAEESEEEDNPEGPDSEAPEQEAPPESDKPDEDPADDDEPEVPDEEVEEPEPESPEDLDDAEEVEEPTAEDEVDDEEELEVEETEEPDLPDLPEGFAWQDGEIVAEGLGDDPVKLDELKDGYLRREDYTQKTQRLSQAEQQARERWQAREELLDEVGQHERMREFISAHPEAVRYLVQNPSEARELMRGPQRDLDEFIQDYEALQENPRLARQYLNQSEEDSARQTLQQERAKREIAGFANELEKAIDTVAESERYEDHISDEDVQQVKEYVMELGGFDENSPPEAVLQGVQRLANIFVTPDGQRLDMQLVVDRLDAITAKRQRAENSEAKKAEEHNKQVDDELEEAKERTPKSPKGKDPAPSREKVAQHGSYRDVISSLRGDE